MMRLFKYFNLILALGLFYSCSQSDQINTEISSASETARIDTTIVYIENKYKPKEKIKLGIDVLQSTDFAILKNKRVGLITNQTGVNCNLESTIDILNNSANVNLVALFGPEHGVRGNIEGGKHVDNYLDKKTNIPVYSLYGNSDKPKKEIIEKLDVLVYDIQDIGVRSYTFISTLGLAIEAASENNIEFVILDRPNPLGGIKVEGNILEKDFISFIGKYPIPYIYGLTCGELANLLIGEKMIKTSPDFKLTVIPMENWKREMTWDETGLFWIPTSPHIPNAKTAFYYPMTGILGELRSTISIGVGYTLPFQIVGAEWIDSEKLLNELNNMKIPGIKFLTISYIPYYAFGKSKTLNGVQIFISDYNEANLVSTQFYILQALQNLYPEKNFFKTVSKDELSMFNKAVGTDKIVKMFLNNTKIDEILIFLSKDVAEYKKKSEKYYLY